MKRGRFSEEQIIAILKEQEAESRSPIFDELLNETLFSALSQARDAMAPWRSDDNTERPHSQLGWRTPADFASTFTLRRALAPRYAKSTTPEHVASPARTEATIARNELAAR
jgi:putative transposase